ncbi:iron chelate uptake ABC transporter family permease subunit [Mycobacterium sp. KBS0706]|uniref:iron chelate uptake ABC transporter family permease subunit n=1 Tax=Mycobacterium sp. KBS0706 TaxID=2578109 RepID=UPI001C8F99A2|nr:iron chelate uptake ABC transporter family permease subunit [Mycobacterium sp. KBS0706]
MTAVALPAPARRGWPVALLVIAAVALTVWSATALLPPGLWLAASWSPDLTDPGQLLFRHAFLPRLAVSWLAGAALGLAGTIFQQVLRNPLAEPTTLAPRPAPGWRWPPPACTPRRYWRMAARAWPWPAPPWPPSPCSAWPGAAWRR